MIRKNVKWIVGVLVLAMVSPFLFRFASCANDDGGKGHTGGVGVVEEKPLPAVEFSSDTAYSFTEKIISFGPRVSTGSKGYIPVRNWVVGQFKRLGADVVEQHFKATSYKGKAIDGTNIIARYNEGNPNRVVLAVHWDSRDVADQDKDRSSEPIVGADDSGSGMGMLLEIGRQFQLKPPPVGVDIVFFDAEDLGESKSEENGWCIGSKYWANQAVAQGYKPKYGILLDMAGAQGARFAKEQITMQYAGIVCDKVWKVGQQLGYGNFFVDEATGRITDDHKYVNEIAHIPMIDIINIQADGHFGDYWHTHKDDQIGVVAHETLKAVGKTLLTTVYMEGVNQ